MRTLDKNLLFLFSAETILLKNVKQILQEGSYDYDSNATQHPWYFGATPFNYRILDHIEHRKEELDFPRWFNCFLKIEEQLKTQEP